MLSAGVYGGEGVGWRGRTDITSGSNFRPTAVQLEHIQIHIQVRLVYGSFSKRMVAQGAPQQHVEIIGRSWGSPC